jgi:hypothetical protein
MFGTMATGKFVFKEISIFRKKTSGLKYETPTSLMCKIRHEYTKNK